jgi:hypothetical protein
VRAIDPDGDDITFSLVNQLQDMDLNRTTGMLVWYPQRTPAGDFHIAVRATDTGQLSTVAIFNVTLHPTNEPPRIQSIGVLRAKVGQRFTYRVRVADPDNDALTFSSGSRLFGINPSSGEISFVPNAGQVGVHEFSVGVRDAGGLNDSAWGVLVVSQDSGGLSAYKIAGYGLAGLGGTSPWLILLISLAVGAALLYQYSKLRRRDGEEPKEATTPAVRAPPGTEAATARAEKAGGVTQEEKKALERKRKEEDERHSALEAMRVARERKERDERGRRAAADKTEKERKVLSKEEEERLVREIEQELASTGLRSETDVDDASKGARNDQGEESKDARGRGDDHAPAGDGEDKF